MARFQKGQSGNPAGRPPGPQHQTKLMEALGGTEALNDIVAVLKGKALEGDTGAAAILLNRLIPSLKPTGEAIALEVPADAGHSEMADAVIKAMSNGKLPAPDAKLMLDSISAAAQVSTLAELEQRITELEAKK